MSLRLRLIVAFFLLSVVPLGAVTFLSYRNNVAAVRSAATREADLLAGELTQRMQLVTGQLSELVEHLMDLPQPATSTTSARSATPVSEMTQPMRAAADSRPPDKSGAPETATATPPRPSAPLTSIPAVPDAGLTDKVATALGEAAMLLNTVELRGLRIGGRGGPPGSRDGQPPDRQGTQGSQTAASSSRGGSLQGQSSRGGQFPPPQDRSGPPRPRGGSRGSAGTAATPPGSLLPGAPPPPVAPPPARTTVTPPPAPGAPPVPPAATGSPAPPTPAGTIVTVRPSDPAAAARGDAKDRILIDLAPIRRELYREILPSGRTENLTPEERQRLAREVNQRLLGIVQGLRIGAEGLQQKAADAERAAAAARTGEKAAASTGTSSRTSTRSSSKTPARTGAATAPSSAAAPTRTSAGATPAGMSSGAATPASATAPAVVPAKSITKKTLTGNTLGVTVEQDGKVLQQASAEINLPNVLATVFTTTPRERVEVPFAIGRDGQLYTPSEVDRRRIAGLGRALSPEGPPTRTSVEGEWIVVTTADPSGSGLRFGIARPVGDSMADLRRTAARNASFGLLFIGIAIAGIVPLSARLTRNLTTLTDGVSRIAQGDFRARVPVRSRDEMGRLATAFNRMAEDVERHQQLAVEQERIRRELELGRRIQNEMLPHAPLRFGLTEVKGISVPAREVGGDFFNYFEVAGGHVALLVGDVSGKGVGAALLMANIQASLRTRLALGQDLSAIADAIDRDIEANSPGPVYSTLFVAILDPVTRQLRYVNAGHHPQYVLRREGGLERMASTGLPVGLLAGRGYTEQQVQLGAGDLLFFYTDGSVDAEDSGGDMFGSERLEALLGTIVSTAPDDVLQHVEASVKRFRGNVEPGDDETMMAVKIG
jgi:serine phosphatase RsbU (regulator of sigma subunit)